MSDPIATATGSTGFDVVTLGECLVALVAESNVALSEAMMFRRHVAGAEANLAVGVARLGHRAAFIGKVGGDAFGQAVVKRLRGEGVDVGHLAVEADGWTALLVRERRGIGASEVWYRRRGSAASTLAAGDVDAAGEVVSSARVLHLTGITPALSTTCREAVHRAVDLASAAGVSVSFDVNLRTKLWTVEDAAPVIEGIAAKADVLLVGLEEGQRLTGKTDAHDVAALYLGAGARSVVVKVGREGARAYGADGSCVERPGVAVDVVDVVGAGDAFAAGYVSGLLDGLPPDECLERGNLCGAYAVASVGDLDGLPTRAEVERLAAGGPDLLR